MENEKPTHEVRLGRIRATVWANNRPGEQPWYRVTTSRLYREADQWRVTQSFRPDDLPALGKVLDLAHDWLISQESGQDYRVEKNGDERSGHDANALEEGEKQNGSNKHGKNTHAKGKRILMRKSASGPEGSTRGGKRSSNSSPRRNRSRKA